MDPGPIDMSKALYVELEEPVAGPPSLFQPLPRDTEIQTNTGDVCVRVGRGEEGAWYVWWEERSWRDKKQS